MKMPASVYGRLTISLAAVVVWVGIPWNLAAADGTLLGSVPATVPRPQVAPAAAADTLAPALPLGVSEVLKMYRGGVGKDIIVAYIRDYRAAIPSHRGRRNLFAIPGRASGGDDGLDSARRRVAETVGRGLPTAATPGVGNSARKQSSLWPSTHLLRWSCRAHRHLWTLTPLRSGSAPVIYPDYAAFTYYGYPYFYGPDFIVGGGFGFGRGFGRGFHGGFDQKQGLWQRQRFWRRRQGWLRRRTRGGHR